MPETDLSTLLREMEPVLHEGVYAFAFARPGREPAGVQPIAIFRESEGTTYVTTEADAVKAKLAVMFRAGWITLRVNSDMTAVGFTAAFSAALSNEGISCNVIAAALHDHIFVPIERAEEALRVLKSLQLRASQ